MNEGYQVEVIQLKRERERVDCDEGDCRKSRWRHKHFGPDTPTTAFQAVL